MDIVLPKGLEVFIFGSFLYKLNPNDLDMLVIYDLEFISSSEVSIKCKECIFLLSKYFTLKVDVIFLTIDENKGSGFVEKVHAITPRRCAKFKEINFITPNF